MFRITAGDQAVNFATIFNNGWTVSISFLDGNITEGTNKKVDQFNFGGDEITIVNHRVETVEVWVFHEETKQEEEIRNGITTNKIAQIMDEVSRRPDPTEGV